jgi:hypothetical protein
VQFIKHILGIEQLETFAETVTKAFDDFIAKHSYLTSRQLQFLDLLKNFVLEKGDVSKRNLIESPFTMLHPEGIRGIFNQKEIDETKQRTIKIAYDKLWQNFWEGGIANPLTAIEQITYLIFMKRAFGRFGNQT